MVGAVTLGPMYAVANAFITSLIRNIMGTGSLLAFPGSMVGAFLAGILYKKFRKPSIAVVGEIVGTGILGAVLAYPVAALILGKQVAVFVYVIPFISSCSVGAIIAYFFVNIPIIKKILINNEVTSDKKHSVDHI